MSLLSLWLETKFDIGIVRKLEDICQSLTLPAEQGRVMEFLTNTKNAQRINGLVEDICEALMDYQVCLSNHLFSTTSDLNARLHYNKTFTMRVVSSL